MMFAGGGLFLSMVATTVWISGDVSRMRTEERAKEAQKCALAMQADAHQAQSATNTAPASDFSTPPAAQADDACPDTGGATTDPNATADPNAIDPVTGQPVAASSDQFTDPNAASTDPHAASFDQNTGAVDPVTGQPTAPPSTSVDPTTGAPIDPASQPLETAPPAQASSGIAEAGF